MVLAQGAQSNERATAVLPLEGAKWARWATGPQSSIESQIWPIFSSIAPSVGVISWRRPRRQPSAASKRSPVVK